MTESVSIDLPLEPESARRAREALECLRGRMDSTSYTDLRLVVSELLVEALHAEAHSVRHQIQLRAEHRVDRVHVEMTQGQAAYRLPSSEPLPGERGWALVLVWRLAERWGLRRDAQRATVWLEMPTGVDSASRGVSGRPE